jgi:tetratricopeptide (TPR) repeat protein
MSSSPTATPQRQPRSVSASGAPALAGALVLIAGSLLAYLPALGAGYIWDDDFYVTANRTLLDGAGLRRIWIEPGATPQYYPLVFSLFWVEHALWGLQPFGYHLVNLLLHISNALLLVAVLKRLEVPGAWLAGVLFALHPVNVESVAWITERKNTLSFFFALLSLLAYMRFSSIAASADGPPRRWGWYLPALALFAAALFSKTVACSLPAVILVLIWWKRGRIGVRDVGPLLPFFLLGGVLAWVTVTMERGHVGAEALQIDLSRIERVLLAGRAFWFYLFKLLAPLNLTFIYPRWQIDDRAAWQYLFPIAVAALLVALWLLRRRIGRGPLAAALLFGGILVPALGFIDVYPFRYSWVADHFQYHASAAALVLLAAIVTTSLGGKAPRLAFALILLGGVLGTLTFRQAGMYRNLETLWKETIARNPGAWMAYVNLGSLYTREDRVAEGLPYVQRALELKPEHPLALNTLAYVALHENRFADALHLCERAVRSPEPPRAEIFNNLGLAHAGLNDHRNAIIAFRKALEIQSDLVMAHANLAESLIRVGNTVEAGTHLDAALAQRPMSEAANLHLMRILVPLGRLADAERCCMAALRANPHSWSTAYQYACLLAAQNKNELALDAVRRILQMKPDHADAHNLLGSLLMADDKDEAAIVPLQEAVRLAPALVEARFNLARALAKVGKKDDALAQLREVLRLDPRDAEARAMLDQLGGSP